MAPITIIGGGLAGLTAAVACAEAGAEVVVHEAHATLGGRARTAAAPWLAHEGPHSSTPTARTGPGSSSATW